MIVRPNVQRGVNVMCLTNSPHESSSWSAGVSRIGARVLVAMLLVAGVGCGGGSDNGPTSPTSSPNTRCAPGQWAVDTGYARAWGHDCNPLPGPHFTIYSDGSSADAKAMLSDMAEDTFADVRRLFDDPSDAELSLTGGRTFYVFAEKTVTPMVYETYPNGVLMPAIDREPQPGPFQRNQDEYRRSVKHEMTHVVSLTLCRGYPYAWFEEGQAVYVSGSSRLPTLEEFRRFVADPTHTNPVAYRFWQTPSNVSWYGTYYPLFGLLYAYLVDAQRGHGATVADMRDLFQRMASGESFPAAFEHALGLRVDELEANYYQIMDAYLSGARGASLRRGGSASDSPASVLTGLAPGPRRCSPSRQG